MDPQQLAYKFLTIIQVTRMLGNEFQEMYPQIYNADPKTKIAIKDGLTGMKSDSADFLMEHSFKYPITLILFYDSDIYLESIMRTLTIKLLDVFIFQFETSF